MDGETSAAVAWICCDPFPPLPVGPWKPTFVVGRKGCDLELIHKEISRRHVAIHVSPSGEMSLEDLGSANGTFLRRRKVSGTVPLRPGDTILIGPYELSVSKDAPDQGVSDISSTAMSTLVSGNLKVTPMAELFSTFEHQHMSGELEVVQSEVLTTNIWANAVGDVSARGDLLFATGGAQGADRRIVFGDADGNEFEWGEEGRAYEDQIAISRDGQRFAAIVVNPRGSFDLWAGERGGERLRMLYGSDSTDVVYPLLSWDGEWVYATEAVEEYSDLRVFRVPFDGSGRREMLWEGGASADFHRLRSISEDGTKLLFDRRLYGGNHDVTLLDLERAPDAETGVVEMVVVIPGQSAEQARMDPLGVGLISYIASPTGLRELFVRPWDPEAPEVLGPAVSVSRDFAYHSWVVVPGKDAGDGTRVPDRLFIVELSLQRGFTRTEVVYENGRIRLGEREAMDRQPIANTVTGDIALDGTEIAIRRGESERLLDRVELVQGLLGR